MARRICSERLALFNRWRRSPRFPSSGFVRVNKSDSFALLRALAECDVGRLAQYKRLQIIGACDPAPGAAETPAGKLPGPLKMRFRRETGSRFRDFLRRSLCRSKGRRDRAAACHRLCRAAAAGIQPCGGWFALHLHSVPRVSGELVVALSYLESGEGVAEWTVPYAQLVPNWNFFSLPRACGGAARTLRLRISATGPETVGVSLGYPIAGERYSARSELPHPDLDLRPLAFKVFTGLPGVKPANAFNMIAPSNLLEGQFIVDYRLPVDTLSQIADVSVTPIVPEFQTVRFLEHEHAIVCHPLPSGISAGAVSRAVEPGTISFSASAVIDHPQGQPAAVGFLLAPANSNARSEVAELARKGAAGPSAFFSGWREVTSNQVVNINIQLEQPVRGPMDLMILSRAVTDSVDFSWLKVSGFRLVKQSTEAADVR